MWQKVSLYIHSTKLFHGYYYFYIWLLSSSWRLSCLWFKLKLRKRGTGTFQVVLKSFWLACFVPAGHFLVKFSTFFFLLHLYRGFYKVSEFSCYVGRSLCVNGKLISLTIPYLLLWMCKYLVCACTLKFYIASLCKPLYLPIYGYSIFPEPLLFFLFYIIVCVLMFCVMVSFNVQLNTLNA